MSADHLAAGHSLEQFAPIDLDPAEAEGNEAQPEEMRGRLAELLRLAGAGICVLAIRMVGNGSSAAVEIFLSNGLAIATERFGDLWTATGLAKFVTQNTGVRATGITKGEAEEASALIRQLAVIEYQTTTGDLGRDHGYEFLRDAAEIVEFTLNDTDSRYDAFRRLDGLNPVKKFEQGGLLDAPESVAAASLVLLDVSTGIGTCIAVTCSMTFVVAAVWRIRLSWRGGWSSPGGLAGGSAGGLRRRRRAGSATRWCCRCGEFRLAGRTTLVVKGGRVDAGGRFYAREASRLARFRAK